MCGRGFAFRFLFSWLNAPTVEMGAAQGATTTAIVMEESASARGREPDGGHLEGLRTRIVETFEHLIFAFHTTHRLLDDGVVDPRDTRRQQILRIPY